ncbi:MAG: hypothetical protein HOP17_02225 [Acidobacteria bacterium]|nr:hypothetical protein [Acidobacteriota bacterium]
MKLISVLSAFLVAILCCSGVAAQRPEVTISLNETFFDSLLDAVFQNAGPIEFSIASNDGGKKEKSAEVFGFGPGKNSECKEVIQLLRETNGVRTAVRFRDGKILAPLAFTGNYNPPFVGCVPFTGYAETVIDLDFDQQNQKLIARARVLNVSLNGTGGVGGTLIAKMVQSSIDKKINPIEVIRLDKLSFLLPIRNSGTLNMKAVGMRTGLGAGMLNIHVAYEFAK